MNKQIALEKVIRFSAQSLNIQSADEATTELAELQAQIIELEDEVKRLRKELDYMYEDQAGASL